MVKHRSLVFEHSLLIVFLDELLNRIWYAGAYTIQVRIVCQ